MNLLAIFAHPDDETIFSGGLLALLAESKFDIHFLSCTRGEGGECGEPPVCEQNELGHTRELELTCAVEVLGGKTLNFLNYQDPLVSQDNKLFSFTENIDELAELIKEYVKKYQIDLIISHGSNGEYGHPGHLTVNQAVEKMVNEFRGDLFWYTVQSFFDNAPKPHLLNRDDPADWILDISVVIEKKIKAAYCHKSQHALFLRKKSKELGRLVFIEDVIVPLESYHLKSGKKDILGGLPFISNNSL